MEQCCHKKSKCCTGFYKQENHLKNVRVNPLAIFNSYKTLLLRALRSALGTVCFQELLDQLERVQKKVQS